MTVRLLAGRFEATLDDAVQVVPAAQVVISVSGARSRIVFLDGRAARLSSGEVGVLSIDLMRSTGFHRLTIDGVTFWFATADAKLGLDGVMAMLDELRTLGTGWTGQAMFSDGSGFRDAHVAYGWLDQWAEEALGAVAAVIETPRSSITTTRVLRRRGGAGVLLAPTLRLLRSDPRRYLVETPGGVIDSDGRRYEPLRVVARHRETTLDTMANRRAIAVLGWIDRLAKEVIAASTHTNAVSRCRLWSNRARTLHQRPLARALGPQTLTAQPRQAEETTEASYRTTYRLARDLQEQFGWSASVELRPRLSYVEQSDSIYQAYVASRLARELGLQQMGAVLGSTQPAFSGDRFDLYYDTIPPAAVLQSWRHHSSRPDSSRPDLLLLERATGAVAVIDAKYRKASDGGASEDSRKDVSAYMSLYGLPVVTILFPGTDPPVLDIQGQGQRMLEVAIAPSVVDLTAAAEAITSTLSQPPY